MKKILLASLLIHSSALLALFFWDAPRRSRRDEPRPVEFTRLDPPKLLKALEGQRDSLGLRNLGPRGLIGREPGPRHAGRNARPDGYEFANGMDFAKESKLYPYFRELWKRIDAATAYPADFVKQRIAGNVTVQLVVDRRGVFTGRFLRADADDLYLKTYAMVTLAHALKPPLPRELWSDHDRMIVVAQFDFSIFTVGHVIRPQELAQQKNLFFFRREAYANPKLNEVIEKLYAKYMPPVIPVPGGAYIDFPRAYEMARNIDKLDEDELLQARLEQMKEGWDRLVIGSATRAKASLDIRL